MSIAPVAAAISGNSSGATKSKIQSIASPGPAMKPSSDIDLFTTTLPFLVLVSLILFLRTSLDHLRRQYRAAREWMIAAADLVVDRAAMQPARWFAGKLC